MIEPQVVRFDRIRHLGQPAARIHSGRGAGPADQPRGGIADADDPRAERGRHDLGHDAGRVGHGDDPGAGGEFGHAPRDRVDHGDRADRVGQPARADRLLPDHAGVQRGALVGDPAVKPAHAQRREDHVGPAQGRVQVGGGAQRQAAGGQHGGDDAESFGQHVVQYDFVDGKAADG